MNPRTAVNPSPPRAAALDQSSCGLPLADATRMAADAALDALAPFLAETLAETPGANVGLARAIAAQLEDRRHQAAEPLADRLHQLVEGLRRNAPSSTTPGSLAVMLAVADAVREVIEASSSISGAPHDAARP